ncbi:MAG: family 43 glycosylhydrolase [Minicystis sp.]
MSRRPEPNGVRIQEGAVIAKRGSYYYMFVNWDFCCGVWTDPYPPYAAGSRPAYRLIVGRSTSLHGPFYGKNGKPMLKGGGTLYLQGNKLAGLLGPGGPAILEENGQYLLVMHAYNPLYATGKIKGVPLSTPQVRKIAWTADDWPVDDGKY